MVYTKKVKIKSGHYRISLYQIEPVIFSQQTMCLIIQPGILFRYDGLLEFH